MSVPVEGSELSMYVCEFSKSEEAYLACLSRRLLITY